MFEELGDVLLGGEGMLLPQRHNGLYCGTCWGTYCGNFCGIDYDYCTMSCYCTICCACC